MSDEYMDIIEGETTGTASTASTTDATGAKEVQADRREKQRKPVKGKKVTSAEGKAVKKIKVTLDTSPEDVIKLSEEGNFLEFSDEVGEFLELSTAQIRQLKADDRQRYHLAYGSWREKYDNFDPMPSGIKVSPRLASATARIAVYGKDPNKRYCWKRPDELRQAGYDGYQFAKGANLRSFSGSPTSVHRVSAMGDDELVLMEISKDRGDAILREPGEKSRRKVETFDQAAKEALGPTAYESAGDGRHGELHFTSTTGRKGE